MGVSLSGDGVSEDIMPSTEEGSKLLDTTKEAEAFEEKSKTAQKGFSKRVEGIEQLARVKDALHKVHEEKEGEEEADEERKRKEDKAKGDLSEDDYEELEDCPEEDGEEEEEEEHLRKKASRLAEQIQRAHV